MASAPTRLVRWRYTKARFRRQRSNAVEGGWPPALAGGPPLPPDRSRRAARMRRCSLLNLADASVIRFPLHRKQALKIVLNGGADRLRNRAGLAKTHKDIVQ